MPSLVPQPDAIALWENLTLQPDVIGREVDKEDRDKPTNSTSATTPAAPEPDDKPTDSASTTPGDAGGTDPTSNSHLVMKGRRRLGGGVGRADGKRC